MHAFLNIKDTHYWLIIHIYYYIMYAKNALLFSFCSIADEHLVPCRVAPGFDYLILHFRRKLLFCIAIAIVEVIDVALLPAVSIAFPLYIWYRSVIALSLKIDHFKPPPHTFIPISVYWCSVINPHCCVIFHCADAFALVHLSSFNAVPYFWWLSWHPAICYPKYRMICCTSPPLLLRLLRISSQLFSSYERCTHAPS